MRLALQQANITLGNTKSNPAVGCVIVKNDCLISAGSTGVKGRPHAEVNAINSSKKNVKNSNLYVTLEPCSHYGRTPPCVKKIIKKKIKKVFFSIKDPDERSSNKSSKQFKVNAIKVSIGINSNKIKNFYKSYILYKRQKLPFVTCKLAVSKDFFTIDKKNKWITNQYSRSRAHLMRARHDCIITSSNTVIADNPHLTCRINGLESLSPSRIILDKRLRISVKSNILKNNYKYKTYIFYNIINKKKLKSLKDLGIKLCKIPVDSKGNLNLIKVLNKAKELGFSRIFLETGIKLSTSFLKKNLVNDLKIFVSDKKINKNGLGNIRKYFKLFLKDKKGIVEKINLFGDKLLSYEIK